MVADDEGPLDNPVYASLAGGHAHLAAGNALVLRYPADRSPLAGISSATPAHTGALAQLLTPGDDISIIASTLPALPARWQVLQELQLVQMIRRATTALPEGDCDAVELGPMDGDAMLALVDVTRPGPFRARTVELGRFVGVCSGGRLVAMCGERLWVGRYREVSGVCTHPDSAGRGLAAALMARVINRMLEAGQVPFLHVDRGNTRAQALYARLGFVQRRELVAVVARAPI